MNEMKCPVCGTVFEAKVKSEPDIMIQGPSEHDEPSDTDIELRRRRLGNNHDQKGSEFRCINHAPKFLPF